jgi:hypothetical protein
VQEGPANELLLCTGGQQRLVYGCTVIRLSTVVRQHCSTRSTVARLFVRLYGRTIVVHDSTVACTIVYWTFLSIVLLHAAHTSCTYSETVVKSCGCVVLPRGTVARLYVYRTYVCSVLCLYVCTFVRLYGFRNPHPRRKRRFFIFFVNPRSSRYFFPTDPRGYRTPTF